jgi:glucose-1-phosphate thymidylyltransferase
MSLAGLVYVPADAPAGWQGEAPGLQQVANRAIVCHALEALATPAVDRLAIVAAPEQLPAIRTAVDEDPAGRLDPVFLALDGRRDLVGALRAAAPFVGDSPAILHLATGLLGHAVDPILDAGDGADLLMLLHNGDGPHTAIGAVTERLLGVSDIGGGASRLGLVEVARFAPGVVARAARVGPEPADDAPDGDLPHPPHELVRVADRLAGDGLGVAAGMVSGWCSYSTDPRNLLELNRSVLDRQPAVAGPPAGPGNRVEGRVVVHPTAEVSSSVLLGPCLIGPGARVSDSYVGPYTTLGPGAVLEGSEVVRSIVAEGARILHVGDRIEGSTIGRRASIFRDFALPRAMRLHVGADVEVALD